MRLKDLFTVPAGQKITEKNLRRVLLSSVCSILLCMSCLLGTTWAWFAVSLENTGNKIYIGSPEIRVTVDAKAYEPKTVLFGRQHIIHIEHANQPDALDKKSTLYVTLTVYLESNGSEADANSNSNSMTICLILNQENGYAVNIPIANEMGRKYTLGWGVSWFEPAGAGDASSEAVVMAVEEFVEEESTTEEATTEIATTEAPVTEDYEETTSEEPATEGPTMEESTTGEPATEGPTMEESITGEPATEEPTMEESTTEGPVTEGPTMEESTTEEPTTEELTTEEPMQSE